MHWFDVSILNNIITESGEWLAGEEKKKVKAYVDIPEFSVGELDDLQVHYIANSKAHLRLTSKSSEHIEMEKISSFVFYQQMFGSSKLKNAIAWWDLARTLFPNTQVR